MGSPGLEEVGTPLREGFSGGSFEHGCTPWRGRRGAVGAGTTPPPPVIYSKSGLPKSVWSSLVVAVFMLWGMKRMSRITLFPCSEGSSSGNLVSVVLQTFLAGSPSGGGVRRFRSRRPRGAIGIWTHHPWFLKTPSLNSHDSGVKGRLGYDLTTGLCFVVVVVVAVAAVVSKELDWACLFLPRKWVLIALHWTRGRPLEGKAFIVWHTTQMYGPYNLILSSKQTGEVAMEEAGRTKSQSVNCYRGSEVWWQVWSLWCVRPGCECPLCSFPQGA